ncbi:BQ2448_343 [Microbotryum intermedium]|uniref:BQ2448_343 protein n=1 Tax=Microbotryum intermedium TaxID=269621 RepID=A0A238F267_9BASI|nr:BQ2448_343 [Microbotryum intermedium]
MAHAGEPISNRLPPELLLRIVSFSVPPASYHAWSSRSEALRSFCSVSSRWRDVAQALLVQAPVIKTEAVAQKFLARLDSGSTTTSSSAPLDDKGRAGEPDPGAAVDRDGDDDDGDSIRNQVAELRLGDNEIFASWTNGFSDVVARCKSLKRLFVLNADHVILAELGDHSSQSFRFVQEVQEFVDWLTRCPVVSKDLHYFHGCNLQFAPPLYYVKPSPPPASPSLPSPTTLHEIPSLVLPFRFMSLSHSGLPLLIPPNSLPCLTHLSLYDVYRSYGLEDALDLEINDYALLLRTLGPQLKAAKLDLVLYPPFDFDTWLPTLSSTTYGHWDHGLSKTSQNDWRGAGGQLQLFQVSSYETPSLFTLLQACQSLKVIIADVFPLDRDTRTHLLGPPPHSFVGHTNLSKIRFRRGPILVENSVGGESHSVNNVGSMNQRVQRSSSQEEAKLIQSLKEGRQHSGLEDEEARFGLTFETYCQEEGIRVE